VGANAASIHYSTLNGDNSTLTSYRVYLLDAGAQYVDCTTDVTRTHHYGVPTDREKNAYTKVLQGAVDLANVVWPLGVYGKKNQAN
jgi:Xaa-Pro aminopeptidase